VERAKGIVGNAHAACLVVMPAGDGETLNEALALQQNAESK